MNHDNFYQRLKQARLDSNIKQEQVAKCLDIPVSAVSAMENGNRKIDIFEMEKLCRLYEKNIQWFLHSADTETDPQCYTKNPVLEKAYRLINQANPNLQTAIAYSIIGLLKHGNLVNNDKQ